MNENVAYPFLRKRIEGHQLHRPSKAASAGTSKARTKNVSINTPIAIGTPICSTMGNDEVARVAKVPAKMMPHDVMTPPV